MSEYTAPLRDMRFVLDELIGLDSIAALPGYGEATPELVGSALEEAGRLAREVLAPLNQSGDRQGARLQNGVVRTPDGFAEAYRRFAEGGWSGVPFDPDHGGQGLPWSLQIALQEIWNAANMSFALCPLLTQGAIELLQSHGSTEQKRLYLPKLIAGEWAGTMELTEPQAGSDLGAVRMRAVRAGDTYRLSGQKIFITYGEHDLAENVVHLVLGRTPEAPQGAKGLSLFIVPKRLPEPDGRPGTRNDLRCVSLERKLGIHASPTAVMSYGENGGAVGWRVGEENRGLEYMFTMMNNARLAVGVQGLAIAERAYQQARAYARLRVQSRDAAGRDPAPVPIIRHPDAAERARHQALVDLLIPVAKAWCTDQGCAVASLNIQVHGGVGYVEETGAGQLYRDARIAPIYEGTNGIQANDLVGRKLMRDGGEAVRRFLADVRQTERELGGQQGKDAEAIRRALGRGAEALARASDWLVTTYAADAPRALAGATPYLALFGTVAGGWLLALSAARALRRLADSPADPDFLRAKLTVARFYAENLLPQAPALATAVIDGAASTLALPEAQF